MELNVLLVEDNPEDYEQLVRDLPDTFARLGHEARIDPYDTFEEGLKRVQDPHSRYDLVISDTYRGEHEKKDAAVLDMINEFKKGKFCPLIIYSSGALPDRLTPTVFVNWVEKSDPRYLEDAIGEILSLGIPQTARKVHDEIDRAAGSFLWEFLEKHWTELQDGGVNAELLERIIKRRVALAVSDLMPGQYAAIDNKYGLEYYIYPALDHDHFSLGDIVKSKTEDEYRLLLTPHCHLVIQQNAKQPKADFVLTIKAIPAAQVLGQKIENTKEKTEPQQLKKLGQWARSPAQTEHSPEGRYWYLPKFLAIPHLFCDFLQVESLDYDSLNSDYDRLATLLPPYAEAAQECFSSFYGSVGIPTLDPNTIKDLLS